MPEVPSQFLKILKLLIDSQIDFVVVVGLGVALHGGDTLTDDLDISFALDAANREKICLLLNKHHPRPLAFPLPTQFQVTPGLLGRANLDLKTDMGAIDLLPLPDGVDSYAGLRERAEIKSVDEPDGFLVAVASIDNLIAMKQAANRPKDQLHIMELRAVQRILGETAPPGA